MGAKLSSRRSIRRSSSAKVADSGEWTCSCGNVMPQEANFCSHCGRRSLRLLEADLVKSPERSQPSSETTSIPEDDDSGSSLSPPIAGSRHSTPLQSEQSSSAVSGVDRDREQTAVASPPKWSWRGRSWNRSDSPKTTPGAYRGWLKSKLQTETRIFLDITPPSDSTRHRQRLDTSDSHPDSPRGTPARRPSFESNRIMAGSEDSSDMLSLLTQTLKHSGSLMMNFVRVRVLVLPTSMAGAHNSAHKADLQMPLFDAKVDFDNLLNALPSSMLNPCQVSMQRVSFMGTDWLGIRLDHQTHAECITFCICAAVLLNVGKSTSRSVVIEACGDDSKYCPGFACIPISDKSDDSISTFIDCAKDISDLADIICNEPGHLPKKVTADLKKWCQKCNRHRGHRKHSSKFSLRRMVESLEHQFAALTPLDCSENLRSDAKRRPSRGEVASQCHQERRQSCNDPSTQGNPRSRRKSCPAVHTGMSVLSFTGISESEEEEEVQRSATFTECSIPIDSFAQESESSSETNQVSIDSKQSQDHRRYSTGNMQCQRRRSGQLISRRRWSSSTLE